MYPVSVNDGSVRSKSQHSPRTGKTGSSLPKQPVPLSPARVTNGHLWLFVAPTSTPEHMCSPGSLEHPKCLTLLSSSSNINVSSSGASCPCSFPLIALIFQLSSLSFSPLGPLSVSVSHSPLSTSASSPGQAQLADLVPSSPFSLCSELLQMPLAVLSFRSPLTIH